MKCPKCKNTELIEKKVKKKNTLLDHCPSCKGMWFDSGELAEVISARAVPSLTVPKYAPKQENMICPRCVEPLYVFCYPGTVILVDMCSSCNGVWLDDQELQEIHAARKARSDKIVCPKCQHEQPKSHECVKCGVIFEKLGRTKRRPEEKDQRLNERDTKAQKRSRGYAEDISGVKGTLLRFIDGAIDKLTNY